MTALFAFIQYAQKILSHLSTQNEKAKVRSNFDYFGRPDKQS